VTREDEKPRGNAYVLSADCRAVTYTKISLSLVDGCSFSFSSADRWTATLRCGAQRRDTLCFLVPAASCRRREAYPAGRPASDDPIPIRTHGGAGGLIGGRTGEPPVDVHEQLVHLKIPYRGESTLGSCWPEELDTWGVCSGYKGSEK